MNAAPPRGVYGSTTAGLARSLVLAIAVHAFFVVMLRGVHSSRFFPRSERAPAAALFAVEMLGEVEEPATSDRIGAAPRLRVEPAPAPAPTPRLRPSRPRAREPLPDPAPMMESAAAVEPMHDEIAPSVGATTEEESPPESDGTGAPNAEDASGAGSSTGGSGAEGTASTATSAAPPPPVDPCGSPWTGVWHGQSRDGAIRDWWTDFTLTLSQRGEIVTGTMLQTRRHPTVTAHCGFDLFAPDAQVWRATTPIWGGLENDELSLRSWAGRPEDYVIECGLPGDYFTRDWGVWDWTLQFHLRATLPGHTIGTWDTGRAELSRVHVARIELVRAACAPTTAPAGP